MGKEAMLVLYVIIMVVVIVTVDVWFFRNHFVERLIANIGIVLFFVLNYYIFLRNR